MPVCKKNDFIVYEHGWEWDKAKNALFWFIVDSKKLSNFVERQGPPVKMKDAVKNFKKEHKNTCVRKGKVFAKDKRKFVNVLKFISSVIKDKYLEDKVKSIKA